MCSKHVRVCCLDPRVLYDSVYFSDCSVCSVKYYQQWNHIIRFYADMMDDHDRKICSCNWYCSLLRSIIIHIRKVFIGMYIRLKSNYMLFVCREWTNYRFYSDFSKRRLYCHKSRISRWQREGQKKAFKKFM